MHLREVSFVRVPCAQVLREPFQQHSRAVAPELVMTHSTLFRVLANAHTHLRVRGTNIAADPCGQCDNTNGCRLARMNPASSCTHRMQARQDSLESPEQFRAA